MTTRNTIFLPRRHTYPCFLLRCSLKIQVFTLIEKNVCNKHLLSNMPCYVLRTLHTLCFKLSHNSVSLIILFLIYRWEKVTKGHRATKPKNRIFTKLSEKRYLPLNHRLYFAIAKPLNHQLRGSEYVWLHVESLVLNTNYFCINTVYARQQNQRKNLAQAPILFLSYMTFLKSINYSEHCLLSNAKVMKIIQLSIS